MARLTVLAALVLVGNVLDATGQQGWETRPTWRDLETWSRFDGKSGTETGLGLQLDHPAGISMAFTVRRPGKSPTAPADEVSVLVAMGPRFIGTEFPNPLLIFMLDEGKPKWTTIDLSSQFIPNEVPPTKELKSGIARMSAEDFRRIVRARAVKTRVLANDATISRAQLDAMRAFAKRVVGQ